MFEPNLPPDRPLWTSQANHMPGPVSNCCLATVSKIEEKYFCDKCGEACDVGLVEKPKFDYEKTRKNVEEAKKALGEDKPEAWEEELHCIISNILVSIFLDGKNGKKINHSARMEAENLILKLIRQIRQDDKKRLEEKFCDLDILYQQYLSEYCELGGGVSFWGNSKVKQIINEIYQ